MMTRSTRRRARASAPHVRRPAATPRTMSLVTELAGRAHAVAEGAIPDDVLATAPIHLTDSVGALVAGHHTLHEAVERLCGGLYPADAADNLAGMRRTALAAAVYTHCWESSDIHRSTVL